jgi:hypothetical protein
LQAIADGEEAKGAMSVLIAEIVRQSIRHARRLSNEGVHAWPAARQALTRILTDLEERLPNDPSLSRLRAFIAAHDCAWMPDSHSPKAGGVKKTHSTSAPARP